MSSDSPRPSPDDAPPEAPPVGPVAPAALPPNMLSLLVEQSGDGIIVADENGVIRVFNAEAERQHGVQNQPVAAPDWTGKFGLFTLDGEKLPLAETPLYRALRGERIEGARWQVRRSDGTFRMLTGTATPLVHEDGSSAGAVIITRDETDRLATVARDQAARKAAEAAEHRFRFLAEASAVLAESLDYEATLQRVAQLAVPRIADWCSVSVLGPDGRLRRVAVVHKDPSKRAMAADYLTHFPPAHHRDDGLRGVLSRGEPILQSVVTDEDLRIAAQDEDHLRLLRALGCTSCMMIPMVVRGEGVGVISLVIGEAERHFGAEDLSFAQEVGHRAAVAVDNARLYREIRHREETMRFLAEASAVLASSLDYESTLQSLAQVVVPRFADWCAVEILEDGVIKQVAVAHVDPAKIEMAREFQRRWPTDPNAATGTPNILRTGKSELYEDIPDELLVAAARDAEHLRLARALGLRSALSVPLSARGRTLGALSLLWAESGRRYEKVDVPVMEELGRRAGIAVDNARLYREAKRAIELRDEFLSIAGHELKTPLTALQLQVASLLSAAKKGTLTADPLRLKERLEKTEAHGRRLNRLIHELLDVSRITAGRLTLDLGPVDLPRLVNEVLERFADDLKRTRTTLSLHCPSPIVIEGDAVRLDQVITNLVSNAIKYGPGKPLEMSVTRVESGARMVVTDHGIGIAQKNQDRIFGRFERAVSERHFGGFGLGLWITQQIVAAHRGTVTVRSAPGEGATFTVDLPASPPKTA